MTAGELKTSRPPSEWFLGLTGAYFKTIIIFMLPAPMFSIGRISCVFEVKCISYPVQFYKNRGKKINEGLTTNSGSISDAEFGNHGYFSPIHTYYFRIE